MKTYTIKSRFGYENRVALVYNKYVYGNNTALSLVDAEGLPYAHLTVNLVDDDNNVIELEENHAFVDVNNLGMEILKWIEDNGLGYQTFRSQQSGFVEYWEVCFYDETIADAKMNRAELDMGSVFM